MHPSFSILQLTRKQFKDRFMLFEGSLMKEFEDRFMLNDITDAETIFFVLNTCLERPQHSLKSIKLFKKLDLHPFCLLTPLWLIYIPQFVLYSLETGPCCMHKW